MILGRAKIGAKMGAKIGPKDPCTARAARVRGSTAGDATSPVTLGGAPAPAAGAASNARGSTATTRSADILVLTKSCGPMFNVGEDDGVRAGAPVAPHLPLSLVTAPFLIDPAAVHGSLSGPSPRGQPGKCHRIPV